MATENNTSTTDSTDETSGQESQSQQQVTTDETSGNGNQQQDSTQGEPTRLPDDHPLVKAYRAQLEANRKNQTSATELAEARAQAAKATQLEDDLKKRPTTEAMETLQARYDRLEEFLTQAGGPLSAALDSRTFTKRLFESKDQVKDIVADWQRANPSATSKALGNQSPGDVAGKHNPNDLIRAAFGGGGSSK